MIPVRLGSSFASRDGPLAEWYRKQTADARGGTRKTMIVALARKLLIGLCHVAVRRTRGITLASALTH